MLLLSMLFPNRTHKGREIYTTGDDASINPRKYVIMYFLIIPKWTSEKQTAWRGKLHKKKFHKFEILWGHRSNNTAFPERPRRTTAGWGTEDESAHETPPTTKQLNDHTTPDAKSNGTSMTHDP